MSDKRTTDTGTEDADMDLYVGRSHKRKRWDGQPEDLLDVLAATPLGETPALVPKVTSATPTATQITIIRKSGYKPATARPDNFVLPMDEEGNIQVGALPQDVRDRLVKALQASAASTEGR